MRYMTYLSSISYKGLRPFLEYYRNRKSDQDEDDGIDHAKSKRCYKCLSDFCGIIIVYKETVLVESYTWNQNQH